MRRERINNFMELYFPGIKEWHSKPIFKFYFEFEFNGVKNISATAYFFCIHHVTDVYNDEWEIKSDDIFLDLMGKIYLLKNITTNYDMEIIFNGYQRSFKYFYEEEKVQIGYSINSKSGTNLKPFDTFDIPKSKWKLVKLLLEITELPKGSEPEEIRKLLIGEKFPLSTCCNLAYRKDGCIFIPRGDVVETLEKSGKNESADYYHNQNKDYISFNSGCYKLL